MNVSSTDATETSFFENVHHPSFHWTSIQRRKTPFPAFIKQMELLIPQSAVSQMRSEVLALRSVWRQNVRLSGRIGHISETHVRVQKATLLWNIHAAVILKMSIIYRNLSRKAAGWVSVSQRELAEKLFRRKTEQMFLNGGTISDKASWSERFFQPSDNITSKIITDYKSKRSGNLF